MPHHYSLLHSSVLDDTTTTTTAAAAAAVATSAAFVRDTDSGYRSVLTDQWDRVSSVSSTVSTGATGTRGGGASCGGGGQCCDVASSRASSACCDRLSADDSAEATHDTRSSASDGAGSGGCGGGCGGCSGGGGGGVCARWRRPRSLCVSGELNATDSVSDTITGHCSPVLRYCGPEQSIANNTNTSTSSGSSGSSNTNQSSSSSDSDCAHSLRRQPRGGAAVAAAASKPPLCRRVRGCTWSESVAGRGDISLLSPISDRSQETDCSPLDPAARLRSVCASVSASASAVAAGGRSGHSSTPAGQHASENSTSSAWTEAVYSVAAEASVGGGGSSGGSVSGGGGGGVVNGAAVDRVSRVTENCVPANAPELLFNMPKLRRRTIGEKTEAGRAERADPQSLRPQRPSSLLFCNSSMPIKVPEKRNRLSLNIPGRTAAGVAAAAAVAGDDARLAAAEAAAVGCTSTQTGRQAALTIDPSLPLHSQSWYHGAITRVQAETVLRSEREGSYLVRVCESNRRDYSLSLRSTKGYMHMKIRRDLPSGRYILGQFGRPFESVVELIRHYSQTELPVRGAQHMALLLPVADENYL